LSSKEYFGQYGKLKKIVVNTSHEYNPKGAVGPSYGAYVTYFKPEDAALAILAVDEYTLE